VSYYPLPSTPERKWTDILDLQVNQIKKSSRVCSDHFQRSQFKHLNLIKNVIPYVKVKRSVSNPLEDQNNYNCTESKKVVKGIIININCI